MRIKIILKGKRVKSFTGIKPSKGDYISLDGFKMKVVKGVVFDLEHEEILVYIDDVDKK